MPGSPTQQFQPTPLATGIGGGLSAAYMLGMGRDNTQAAAQSDPYVYTPGNLPGNMPQHPSNW